ncbi:MAG: alpha/beta hydrolase-fold protein [Xanthomonadales bacterium]|nr:alpha/beta hydrolase-fold protein [Xanthomonadales bacterium]
MENLTLRPRPVDPGARLEQVEIESRALNSNPWGDPTRRRLWVYLPPGYHKSDQRYPVLWYLAAFTNSGAAAGNWRGFSDNLFQRVERLILAEKMGPVIVAAPDCFTTLGGNQYINSPGTGAYADYLQEELVPWVDQHYRTVADRNHRGVFGKSSGGFGALNLVMDRPDLWGALASQSGDAAFEWVYRNDFPKVAATLDRYKGDVAAFIRYFWRAKTPGGSDFLTLMHLCLAATYDPDPNDPCSIRLPFNRHTLEIDEERWGQWMAFDPVAKLPGRIEALKSMRGIYIDCGSRDQYHIHYGSRRLSRLMAQHEVEHQYLEFDGTHSNIDHRFDQSLPFLYQALSLKAD